MSYERRSYSGSAVAATVTSGLSGATSSPGDTFGLSATTGWPTGASGSFAVVVDRGTANEEKILCESRTGSTVTIETRGYDSASPGTGVAHTPGSATVELCLTSIDIDEANYTASQTVGLVTTKGDSLVATSAGVLARLAVGTNNHVRVADSAQATGQKWALLTPQSISGLSGIAKGGLATATGTNTFSALAVGTDGQVFIADSGEATGNKWGQVATDGLAAEAVTAAKIAGVTDIDKGGLVSASAAGTLDVLPIDADGLVLAADSGETVGVKWAQVGTLGIAAGSVVAAHFAGEASTAYTPTWAAAGGTAPDIGNGTLTGWWWQYGKIVEFGIYLRGGGTTVWGSGANFWTFTLPGGVTSVASRMVPLNLAIYDASDSNLAALVTANGRGAVVFGGETTVWTNLHSTSPITFATSDVVSITGRIEVA